MAPLRDLELMIQSHYPLIVIEKPAGRRSTPSARGPASAR